MVNCTEGVFFSQNTYEEKIAIYGYNYSLFA